MSVLGLRLGRDRGEGRVEGEGRGKGEGTVKGIGFIWPFTLQLLLPHTPAGHLVGAVQLLCGHPLYLDTRDVHHMIQSHPSYL